MDRIIVNNVTAVSINDIEEGNCSGLLLGFKENKVVGVITYWESVNQWKFVNSLDFCQNIANSHLDLLLNYLYSKNYIDKAILRN